ncbi:LOW QUALITY PROTEIN: hypothetical protein BT93_H1544 [Corymbia citriodora subsp. variegata]|nr:LOW QUALITY PROTEIN: hypothetical protein BT93_H1544 [Corymbia citriodora subsp. variegata]
MNPKVYEAAKSGDFDSLEAIILGNGEDNFHQTTPKANNILHVAAQYKQDRPFFGNYRGDTPLHLAAKVGSQNAIQLFISLAKSLHWVVENRQVDACKELLRKPNLHKDTMLHYALSGGHYWVVKLLIEEDPQLCNITNVSDESPLYVVAERGLFHTIDLILGACSVSSSHKGPRGLTVMHATMFRPPTSWWKILEKRPEMMREGDDMGLTPLHYLACFGKVEAVRFLLQDNNSAAYDIDKEGQSALHIAAFRGKVNVIDELFKSCPDACDIINTRGQTALHAAVIGGSVNVVKYIQGMPNLENLISEQDTDGNTALHLAALHKQYNIIYMLARDKRMDRFAKNKDHLTTLDIFSTHKEVGYRAAKVKHELEGYHGRLYYQDWVIKYVKGLPAVSITTGTNTANRENYDSSKRSFIDLQLLAAVLIATVTFAAAFTLPGGYINDGPNQGMATLAGRAAFQAFVTSDVTAFGFSILVRYADFTGNCICIAIISMVLAFACGMHVVSTRNIGLGIFPYVLGGCLGTIPCIAAFLEPDNDFPLASESFRNYVRNLLFDYDIL